MGDALKPGLRQTEDRAAGFKFPLMAITRHDCHKGKAADTGLRQTFLIAVFG